MASTPSFSICGLTLEAAYQKLDEEIASLQGRLSALCTLRNSLAPISTLPVELISKIFVHTQRDHLMFTKQTDLRSRLLVSWVCRRWRDIALTTPTLWTTISKIKKTAILRSDCARELLVRSRSMGLAVNLCEPSHDALEIFLAQMSRMKHFRLKYNRLQNGSQLIPPAPALVSLELIKVIPPSTLIFGGDHPCLRHLSMKSVPFTNLEAICFIDEKHDIIFNLLLHCFDIPQVAVTIAWSARPGNQITGRRADILRASINSFLCEAGIPIRHLRICRDDPDYIVDISSSPSQHRYSFDFSHGLNFHITSHWLRLLIPSHNIETLDINDLPKDALEVVIGAVGLKSVKISGVNATGNLIEVLGGRVLTSDSLPLPSLKELTVNGVDFDEVEALGDILTKRHEAGSGLDKLVFMECMNVGVDSFKGSVKVTQVVA
ncbi:hypothetical protein BDN72DRAFT_905541 [Pluteus cervinus]|uniref:Uncharacterized protein n=1 Tax=Pluteus cervinus TaxID=181527 RepID=A0ACD3A309_9AGAR|nr:hypothetical protein BDN72DRAFT_905541 [Pluteus cervinus]